MGTENDLKEKRQAALRQALPFIRGRLGFQLVGPDFDTDSDCLSCIGNPSSSKFREGISCHIITSPGFS